MKTEAFRKALDAAKDAAPNSGGASLSPRALGPVKGVAETLEQYRSLSGAQSLDPADISPSPFVDRVDVSEDIETLKASIAEFGQKVPILVRPRVSPGGQKHFEVIYGRRRLEACRLLGRMVQALVAEMPDEDAVRLQGIENVERLDTSFIERALFARSILAVYEGSGEGQSIAMKALGIDETELSRLKTVAETVPETVIRKIGAAHKAGRGTWLALRDLIKKRGITEEELLSVIDIEVDSTSRLRQLVAHFRRPSQPMKPEARKTSYAGGRLSVDASDGVLTMRAKPELRPFLKDLASRIDDLYAEWLKGRRT